MSWHVPGYNEIGELGSGSSGRVVLAEQESSGLKVAIKYLARRLRADPEFVDEFRAEARIMAEMDHAHIVRLLELVDTPEGIAIVMELVDGVPLRAMLHEHGPAEPEAALVVLKGSLLGLAAAHAAGVVHRDYKPENILVGRNGGSKLADFGIATRVGGHGPLAGTPPYMAPEQWSGSPAGPATDIYAATATFFECLTGRPPFQSPEPPQLRWMHEHKPVPLHLVPHQLQGLIERGMAKQACARPEDATTFLRELEAAATTGYGRGWEKKGRKKLARRSLLMAALSPLVALQPMGAAATTALVALPTKVSVLITAGIATVVFGTGAVWYTSQDAGTGDPVSAPISVQSMPTPPYPPVPPSEGSPSAGLPTTGAAVSPAAAPASTKPSGSAPLAAPPGVSPSPTRPNTITAITLNSFCWLHTDELCDYRPYSHTRATVVVDATQPQPVSVHFRYEMHFYGEAVPHIVEADRGGDSGQTITHVADLSPMQADPCSYVQLTVSVVGANGTLTDSARIYAGCTNSPGW